MQRQADLATRARAKLKLRQRQQRRPAEPFAAFAARHGMTLTRPVREVADLVERHAAGEEVRAVLSLPPRHGKTDTVLRGFAWLMLKDPSQRHAFVTYAQRLANSKSRRARRFAEAAGVSLEYGAQNLADWRTTRDGGLLATSIGGPLTGEGITGLGVIDDPVKNRQEAESLLVREAVWEFYTDVFYTRLEPGASAVVVMTRWHPDDLAGRLEADGWEVINLPALTDDGEALWPERYPAERLEGIRRRVGPYTWASLYQGRPVPKGGEVFKGMSEYDALPDTGYRAGVGFDAAYTAKTRSDHSVTLLGRRYGDALYLTGMLRGQEEPRLHIARMKRAGVKHVHWHRSGTEAGLELLLNTHGIAVTPLPTTTDKHARAQNVAADWNAGKVFIPSATSPHHGEWVSELLTEVLDFTGVSDRHDDVVDALAALHGGLFGDAAAPYTLTRVPSVRAGIARR